MSVYKFNKDATKLEENYQIKNDDDDDDITMHFLILGDYGWNNTIPQQVIAKKMNLVAQEYQAEFVVGLGDNFYQSGVTGINDPTYDTNWKNVFQTQPYLKTLKWYGVIGNHDFNGTGLLSEFEYKQAGWQIDDFFWSHKHKLGKQTVSFVHIDTNYLGYGPAGEPGFSNMPIWFKRLGWTDPFQMLEKADQVFQKNKDSDWILSVGHHPIGATCPQQNLTFLYYDILKKYNVSAYFHGHVHSQAFGQSEGIGFYLSGAGGEIAAACNQSSIGKQIWSMGNIYGFTLISLNSTSIDAKYYYTSNYTNPQWQIYNAPTIQRRIINK